jgi:hypothetical protein
LTHRREGGSVVDDHRSPFSGGGHLQDSTSHLEFMTTDPPEDIGIKTRRHLEVETTDSREIKNIRVTTVVNKDMRIVGAGLVIRVMVILLHAQLMVMLGIDQEIAIDNTTGNARYSRLKLKMLIDGKCQQKHIVE